MREVGLWTPQWLEEHSRTPRCAWSRSREPGGYDAGNIDGAVLWNVYSDSQGQKTVSSQARRRSRPGPAPKKTTKKISPDSTVCVWLMHR